MVESESAGGDVFYDLVYDAARPEVFFQATPHRVVGDGEPVRIRRDSTWDVPEPEFTVAVSPTGRIIGYTIGNDMSSRSIEGENPLYLPPPKVYGGCAALDPRLVLRDLPPSDTRIGIDIRRAGASLFAGQIALDQIKRSFDQLVECLFCDNSFPNGVYVMTGTASSPVTTSPSFPATGSRSLSTPSAPSRTMSPVPDPPFKLCLTQLERST